MLIRLATEWTQLRALPEAVGGVCLSFSLLQGEDHPGPRAGKIGYLLDSLQDSRKLGNPEGAS